MALTIRISPEFNKSLDKLKKMLEIGTGSGAIKFVENYADTVDKLQETRKELAETRVLLETIIDINKRRQTAESDLAAFLKKRKKCNQYTVARAAGD